MSSVSLNSSSVTSSIVPVDNAERSVAFKGQEPKQDSVATLTPLASANAELPSLEELQDAIDVMNNAVAIQKRSLSFSIDDDSGREVIKVVDFKTSELIRQIPSEELLKVAQDVKRLQQEMGRSIGLLVNSRA